MVQMVGRAMVALLVLVAAGCDGRPLPLLRPATPMPQDAGGTPEGPEAPLGLSARFHVDLRVDNGVEGVNVSALFWTGSEPPKAGGGGGPSLRLDHEAGESITVNDFPWWARSPTGATCIWRTRCRSPRTAAGCFA